MTLDLHHLRAFAALARHPSLTAAARELHCSQSALSHLVTDLEQRLGIALVARDRRPVALTAAGRRIAACAASVLPTIAATATDLDHLRRGTLGRLLISLECHSCIEWLAPALDAYRRELPAIEVDLRLGGQFDPLPGLRDGAVDLVITAERDQAPGIIGDPLFAFEMRALLPSRHPLAKHPTLEPRDFAGQTIITYPVPECRLDLYTRFLEPAGIVPADRRTAELTAVIVQWVASGLGVAALPGWALPSDHPQVVSRPLGRGGLWADLYALRRREDAGAAHLDRFLAIARRECFANLAGIRKVKR